MTPATEALLEGLEAAVSLLAPRERLEVSVQPAPARESPGLQASVQEAEWASSLPLRSVGRPRLSCFPPPWVLRALRPREILLTFVCRRTTSQTLFTPVLQRVRKLKDEQPWLDAGRSGHRHSGPRGSFVDRILSGRDCASDERYDLLHQYDYDAGLHAFDMRQHRHRSRSLGRAGLQSLLRHQLSLRVFP